MRTNECFLTGTTLSLKLFFLTTGQSPAPIVEIVRSSAMCGDPNANARLWLEIDASHATNYKVLI